MPVPLAYSACRVCVPIVSASRGVPVTATVRSHLTVTTIRSPKVNVKSGVLFSDSALTDGRVVRPPFTLWDTVFGIARGSVKAAAESLTASLIVPPFSVSALVATLIPSASTSDACTL